VLLAHLSVFSFQIDGPTNQSPSGVEKINIRIDFWSG
jgi:hypothetical protein